MADPVIFAVASGAGKAGVCVIRVSGAGGHAGLSGFVRLPPARQAAVRRFVDADGGLIDHPLVLCFEVGKSFTGEESVELHLHGSRAVVSSVLDVLAGIDGFRPAEPGEFTRRAFENGKLDLTQVEGLSALIDAETEAQRKLAMDVYEGGLSERIQGIRQNLLRAMALIEATIDFADEEVPQDVWPEVDELVVHAVRGIEAELSGAKAAERLRHGFEVAIVGPPNVGKSSLLNAISGRAAAIVTDIPGTTRDVIEVSLDLRGLPVTLIDTAGLRETDDVVEQEGVRRALARAEAADLRLFLKDAEWGERPDGWKEGDLLVSSKGDLTGVSGSISTVTSAGLDALIGNICARLEERAAGASLSLALRHRVNLAEAGASLSEFGMVREEDGSEEVLSENLRSAAVAMDTIVGRIDVEDVLGEIFSSFCIGK